MTAPCNWKASSSKSGTTATVRLFRDEKPISFKVLFDLLQNSPDFTGWYAELLRSSPFAAFFWEHPPLTVSSVEHDAEFVMIDAPMLAGLSPDPNSFRAYFGADEIVTFLNIGGDATLIAPSPRDSRPGYAHLGAFLQNAPETQVVAMWQSVGRAVCHSLSGEPLWLSTSGLGIAWLHIRLDSTPKYYQHQPYKLCAPVAT